MPRFVGFNLLNQFKLDIFEHELAYMILYKDLKKYNVNLKLHNIYFPWVSQLRVELWHREQILSVVFIILKYIISHIIMRFIK